MMGTLVYILTKLAQGSQHTLGPSSSQVSNHNIPKIEYAELFERLIPKFYTQIHVIQNHFLWFITKRKDFYDNGYQYLKTFIYSVDACNDHIGDAR